MFRVTQDFAHDMPVQDALELISKFKGKIHNFKSIGPGGGNPCLVIDFESADEALDFLKEMSPDETDEFLNSLIKLY